MGIKGYVLVSLACVWSATAVADLDVVTRVGADIVAKRLCDLPGFRSCSDLQGEIESAAIPQIKKIIETAYQGQSPTQIALPGGRSLRLPFIHMRTPVCNPLSEIGTNHLGQSCGTPCSIVCRSRSDGRTECGVADSSSCQRERAWIRGAYLQMARSAANEVQAEVRASGALRMSPECNAPMADATYAGALSAYSHISSELAQITGNTTPSCQGTADTETAANRSEILPCHLSAVRRALELAIAEAMVCETLHRADQRWYVERNGLGQISNALIQRITSDSICAPYFSNRAQLETCVRQNYEQQISDAFTQAMTEYRDGI